MAPGSSARTPRDRRQTRRAVAAGVVALPLAGFGGVEAWFAPRSRPWSMWAPHDPSATDAIDHTAWDGMLGRYVVAGAVARFRYGAVSTADRAALKAYIAGLGRVAIARYARAEQLAYWANLYNALTIDVVLDHYPVASVRDVRISPGLFAFGPWDKALVAVQGVRLTLNDIEHRILRPLWRDPRIHYVLNCASLGCPSLPARALGAATIAGWMDEGARRFVNGHGVRADGARLGVSRLYAWFIEDFGGSERAVIAHLRRHAAPELAAALEGRRGIDDDFYDWGLNDAPA